MRHAYLMIVPALLASPAGAGTDGLPANALRYLPLLVREQEKFWPDAPDPTVLAAQIEQETCRHLSHRDCWSPRAELKTSREYGFGLGQVTVTGRFDTFAELRRDHQSLRAWKWENRYDPVFQLRALVLKDYHLYRLVPVRGSGRDRLAAMLSAYNGGLGGLLADWRLCRATPACNPDLWFGHVALTSRKSRKKWKGYGASPHEINRTYVHNVLRVRLPRYIAWFRARKPQ